MIAAGREIQKRILLVRSGVITLHLLIRAAGHNQVGATTTGEIPLPTEDKVHLIGETLPAVLQMVVPEVCLQEVHPVEVAVDRIVVVGIQGVGINFKKLTYENFKWAYAQWNCFALR